MINKFITVSNQAEANRAARYLEKLGYVLTPCLSESFYDIQTVCLSTSDDRYYFSTKSPDFHITEFKEVQISVPAHFEPIGLQNDTPN